MEAGSNFNKPTIHVNWIMLVRIEGHKVECPVCEEGILTMIRNSTTGELLKEDQCCFCGQHVIYDDIDLIRRVYP